MIIYILLIFLIAFVFYGLIPGIGAFLIRAQWSRFRRRLISASLLPIATSTISKTQKGKYIGDYRCFGTLEAIQGNNRVWIAGKDFSIAADLEKTSIYLLSSYPYELQIEKGEQQEYSFPDEEPTYIPWKKISSLPSGIQIFICGSLFIEDGRFLFKSQQNTPLLVVIYDGNKELLLERSIWSARQKNEYLNQFTPVSHVSGSLSLLLIAFILSRLIDFSLPAFHFYSLLYSIPAIISLTLGLFPIIYLLPPGVFFYFLYRRFWKRARLYRAERDLLKLPLRYMQDLKDLENKEYSFMLPDKEQYSMLCRSKETAKQDPLLTLNIPLRECSLQKEVDKEKDYYFFGISDNNGLLKKPHDPMCELIYTPGNPYRLAEACQKKAIKVGLLSAFFIFSGLGINLISVFFILFRILIFLLPGH
jgi:hypothetical protein